MSMQIAKINSEGVDRVLRGEVGMTFPVDHFTDSPNGRIAHVRDYRYAGGGHGFQIWSVAARGYDLITD